MARYFQCGDPTGSCELSRTKQIVCECPCANPHCESFRTEVSFLKAHEANVKWVAIGIVTLLALLLAINRLKGDPLVDELTAISKQTALLGDRLVALENRPKESNSNATSPMLALRQFEANAKESEAHVVALISAGKLEEAGQELKKLARLPDQVQGLARTARTPAPTSAGLVMDAKSLRDDYKATEEKTEDLLSRLNKAGKTTLATKCDGVHEELETGFVKANKLVKGSAVSPPNEEELTALLNRIKALADGANAKLANAPKPAPPPPPTPPPPPPPFDEKDATLKIATSGDLGAKLILPLLKSRSGGESTHVVNREKGIDSWYFTSGPESPSKERVLLTQDRSSPVEDLTSGLVDLAIVDRSVTAGENDAFSGKFPGESVNSRSHTEVIAMDAVTFVTHPDSTAAVVTPEMLKPGTQWIGGARGSAEKLAAGRFGIPISHELDTPELRPADAVLQSVDLFGVGVFHNEGANIRAKRLPYQAEAKAQQLKPSPFTIATEEYKYSFRIMAVNSPVSRASALDFVRYATSDKGQEAVASSGFVDLRLRPLEGDVDPVIMVSLGEVLGLKSIKGAARLSTNFHFAFGSDKLDVKGLADVERVPGEIAKDYRQAKIVIIGFTDDKGGPQINLPLSKSRAEIVAVELRKSGLDVKTAGLGDQRPLDTNSTDEGRAHNRRSEIWVVSP